VAVGLFVRSIFAAVEFFAWAFRHSNVEGRAKDLERCQFEWEAKGPYVISAVNFW
jgi:hypothetical protein